MSTKEQNPPAPEDWKESLKKICEEMEVKEEQKELEEKQRNKTQK